MSVKNPEYDFKWCPGCGDFGVRRALEAAIEQRRVETELPVENNVIVAGIGCSGNMVHLLEGPQPYGLHGIHGRTLPIALGVKMGRPDLNVVVVAGDGDFLSIGNEHIGPQAARNLDVTVVIMDNAVYGLTKGQSSPTTKFEEVTSSTPYRQAGSAAQPPCTLSDARRVVHSFACIDQSQGLGQCHRGRDEPRGFFYRTCAVTLYHLQQHFYGIERECATGYPTTSLGHP